jgi:hypothetical protein
MINFIKQIIIETYTCVSLMYISSLPEVVYTPVAVSPTKGESATPTQPAQVLCVGQYVGPDGYTYSISSSSKIYTTEPGLLVVVSHLSGGSIKEKGMVFEGEFSPAWPIPCPFVGLEGEGEIGYEYESGTWVLDNIVIVMDNHGMTVVEEGLGFAIASAISCEVDPEGFLRMIAKDIEKKGEEESILSSWDTPLEKVYRPSGRRASYRAHEGVLYLDLTTLLMVDWDPHPTEGDYDEDHYTVNGPLEVEGILNERVTMHPDELWMAYLTPSGGVHAFLVSHLIPIEDGIPLMFSMRGDFLYAGMCDTRRMYSVRVSPKMVNGSPRERDFIAKYWKNFGSGTALPEHELVMAIHDSFLP